MPAGALRPPERDQGRRRALLIHNERSGSGTPALPAVLGIFKSAGLETDLQTCAGGDELCASIVQHAHRVDLVIIGGGDGTLHAAAPALMETGLALGILPMGTANDLARTLDIPADILAAARVISEGHQRVIDLGEVNGIPFLNVASLGLSVEVASNLTRDLKQRWGKLGYAIATVRVLARMRPFSAVVEIDGAAHRVKTVQIAVGSGRHYGSGLTVEADAQPDDGWLDLYSLEFESLWKLALIYPALRAGRHGIWHEVRAQRCLEVKIETRRPRPVNADGEIVTTTPAVFRLLPQALTVVAPPHPSTPSP